MPLTFIDTLEQLEELKKKLMAVTEFAVDLEVKGERGGEGGRGGREGALSLTVVLPVCMIIPNLFQYMYVLCINMSAYTR